MLKKDKKAVFDTVRCPYIPDHVMHISSLATHLARCKASNKGQFSICPYNSLHVVPKQKITEHSQNCEDKETGGSIISSPEQIIRMNKSQNIVQHISQDYPSSDDFWQYPTSSQQYISSSQDNRYSHPTNQGSYGYSDVSEQSDSGYGYYDYCNSSGQELPSLYDQYYDDYTNYPQRVKVQQSQNIRNNNTNQPNFNKKKQTIRKQQKIIIRKQDKKKQTIYPKQQQKSPKKYPQPHKQTYSITQPYKNNNILQYQSQQLQLTQKSFTNQNIQNTINNISNIVQTNKQEIKSCPNRLNQSFIQDQDILQFINQIDKNLNKITLQTKQQQTKSNKQPEIKKIVRDFRFYDHSCRNYQNRSDK